MRAYEPRDVAGLAERLDALPWPISMAAFADAVAPWGWAKGPNELLYRTGFRPGVSDARVTDDIEGNVLRVFCDLVDPTDAEFGQVNDLYAAFVNALKAAWGKAYRVRGGKGAFTVWTLSHGGAVQLYRYAEALGLCYFTPRATADLDTFI